MRSRLAAYARLLHCRLQGGDEAVEKWLLGFADVGACFIDREPAAAIDFRDFDEAAGARRTLDLAGVDDEVCGVAIARAGPGGD